VLLLSRLKFGVSFVQLLVLLAVIPPAPIAVEVIILLIG
jgi:hypothetical protein